MNRFAKKIPSRLIAAGIIPYSIVGLISGHEGYMDTTDSIYNKYWNDDDTLARKVSINSYAVSSGMAVGVVVGIFWPIFAARFDKYIEKN